MIRHFLFALISFSTLFSLPISANEDSKHVVMLLWRGVTDAERGFMDYLSKQRAVTYTQLDAQKDKQALLKHLSHIDELKPDLVYTFGTTTTLALLGTVDKPSKFRLKKQTPVVFNIVTDPVGSQLLEEGKPRPFTGVSHIVPISVQLNVIEQLKGIHRIGVLYNPLENNAVLTANKLQQLAQQHNYTVSLYPLPIVEDQPDLAALPQVITAMKADQIQMAYLPPDSYIISNGETIVRQLHQNQLLTFSATETPLRKHQALFGVVSRYYNAGQFSAHKAEQILSGESQPSEVPVESLSQYSYIVNIDAAKQLDYYPPVSILKISELIGNTP